MVNYYRWFLLIPIFILILATSILLSGETFIKNKTVERGTAAVSQATESQLRLGPRHDSTLREDIKVNRESAYPYFLLGAGLLVFLLVLPKLGEVSFSPSSGFTLKVLQEAQEALAEARTATLAIEAKVKQPSSRTTITAEPTLTARPQDLDEEIKKLEESTAKLQTVARLLEIRSNKNS